MLNEEESAIIRNCRDGRLDQFALLYDEYINKIYRFIFFKTHHKETAEDLASTVFIKALENIKKYDSAKASFSVWLYSIARNTVIDHYRTGKDTVDIDGLLDLSSDELNIADKIDIDAKISEVREYLKKLTPEQREIVVLRVWEGLSYKEISAILGKSENSSKVMFSRVMSELRKEFGSIAVLLLFLSL